MTCVCVCVCVDVIANEALMAPRLASVTEESSSSLAGESSPARTNLLTELMVESVSDNPAPSANGRHGNTRPGRRGQIHPAEMYD